MVQAALPFTPWVTVLAGLLRTHVKPALDFVADNCRMKVRASPMNLMRSCLNLLIAQLQDAAAAFTAERATKERARKEKARAEGREPKKEDEVKSPSMDKHPSMARLAKLMFAFGMTWSFGGNVDDASRPVED